jgi:hypothetical protein
MKTKAIVNLKAGESIRNVNGILSQDITKEDLEKNPEKYVHNYGHLYTNKEALLRELALKTEVVKTGSENKVVQSKAKSGQVYSVIAPKFKPKSDKVKALTPQEIYAEKMKALNLKKEPAKTEPTEVATTKKTKKG